MGGVKDYFYQYGPSYGDGLCSDGKTIWDPVGQCNNKTNAGNQVGYFGYKVLAVSYGGTLELFGYKGTPLGTQPQQAPGFSFDFRSSEGMIRAATTARTHPERPIGRHAKRRQFLRFSSTDCSRARTAVVTALAAATRCR